MRTESYVCGGNVPGRIGGARPRVMERPRSKRPNGEGGRLQTCAHRDRMCRRGNSWIADTAWSAIQRSAAARQSLSVMTTGTQRVDDARTKTAASRSDQAVPPARAQLTWTIRHRTTRRLRSWAEFRPKTSSRSTAVCPPSINADTQSARPSCDPLVVHGAQD